MVENRGFKVCKVCPFESWIELIEGGSVRVWFSIASSHLIDIVLLPVVRNKSGQQIFYGYNDCGEGY